MATPIIVPPLSQTMDSLVFVTWLKQVGERVEKGEPLYQVETDKAVLDVEAPAAGIVQEASAAPGSEVLVKSTIGLIVSPAEQTSVQPGAAASPRQSRIFASPRARNLAKAENVPLGAVQPSGPQVKLPHVTETQAMIVERDVRAYVELQKQPPAPPEKARPEAAERPASRPAEVRATPLARRVAQATGVDLETVAQARQGTVIRRADVEGALRGEAEPRAPKEAAAAAPPPVVTPTRLAGKGRPVALSALRKTIARRMQASHQITAPVTLMREVDATELVNLRANILNELPADAEAPRPTYTDFLMVILAHTLPRHPHLNALYQDEEFVVYDEVHLALAIETERGLVAPVIHDLLHKPLLDLAAARVQLAERAHAGTLAAEELSGGTFTLTNLGALGIDGFTPLLNPPQVAILGMGRIRPVPAVVADQVSIRQVMTLSLTFDHRLVDGAPAAKFLLDMAQLVEKPYLIWLANFKSVPGER